MEEETIKVDGNFAVKVGKMWVSKQYSDVELKEQPNSLISFKEAYELREKTGGSIFMFKPIELDLAEIENLKLAAEITKE